MNDTFTGKSVILLLCNFVILIFFFSKIQKEICKYFMHNIIKYISKDENIL